MKTNLGPYTKPTDERAFYRWALQTTLDPFVRLRDLPEGARIRLSPDDVTSLAHYRRVVEVRRACDEALRSLFLPDPHSTTKPDPLEIERGLIEFNVRGVMICRPMGQADARDTADEDGEVAERWIEIKARVADVEVSFWTR